MMDPVKVDRGDDREIREDHEAEIGVGGEICIVEPLAKGVVGGAGGGGRESGGEGGVCSGGEK